METHDLTKKGWGNDYAFTAITGDKARMTVWSGKRIKEGDYIIVRNGEHTTRYQVDNVKRMTDPPDQMFLDVTFAPRSPEPETKKDALLEFSTQFLALDQSELIEWMHSLFGLYREYVDVHGFTPEAAESTAITDMIAGAESIVELESYGEL